MWSRFQRARWGAIGAIVVLVGSLTVVTGAIPAANGRINGCYNVSNGSLRLVDRPADCKSTERAIFWNQQGVPGEDGAPGPEGPEGDAGPPGPRGPQGPAGGEAAETCPSIEAPATSTVLDRFLRLDGIEGESRDDDHVRQIDVLGTELRLGVEDGLGCVARLTIDKRLDRSTIGLLQHLASGEPISDGAVAFRKPGGGGPIDFLTWSMENVRVSGYSTTGQFEAVTLDFSRLTVTYRRQKPDGTLDTPISRSWNFATGSTAAFAPDQDPGSASVETACGGPGDVVAPAAAAMDVFADIDGMPGESQDSRFANTVDVTGQEWGFGRATDRFCTDGVELAKVVDRASPLLFEALASQAAVSDVLVSFRRAGGAGDVFLTWSFGDARVTKLGQAPTGEAITLVSRSIEVTYVPQRPDGTADTPLSMTWDFSANAP